MKKTRWSPEEKSKLVVEYESCNGCFDILCKKFTTRTKSSIKTMCRDLNLRHRKKWTPDDIEQLKILYKNTSNCVLEKIFDTNYRNIEFKANSLFLYKDKKHNLEKLLDESNQSMYWIGFIYTDGGFYYNKNSNSITLSIELSIKDYNHLVSFSNYIGLPLTRIKTRERMSFGSIKKYCCVNTSDINSINKICQKFDIKPKKTYNPPSPSIVERLSNDQIISMLCGMIDGDGSMDTNGRIHIAMHKSWSEFILSIARKLNINYSTHTYKNIFKLSILKRNSLFYSDLKKFLNQHNISILHRKWHHLK